MSVKRLTELKTNINSALRRKKQEMNQLGQLQQQLEEAQKQLQQLSSENQTLNSKLESLNEAKLQLEQERLKSEIEINWFKARTDKAYKDSTAETNKQKVNVEIAQMYDGNPHNDEIKY